MTFSSKFCYFYRLLRFIFSLSFTIQLSYCANSIIPGQSLYGNRSITSPNGSFVLTFFKPGKSNVYYIGIRCKIVPHKPIVWVANRNVPVSNPSSSQLKIAEDGNLVIVDKHNVEIWSTNLTSLSANSTQAQLLENGNLVLTKWPSSLVEGKPVSPVLWQSFDHPTDTWLNGGKIGFSKLTNSSQMLTSWRNIDDPAEGQFSMRMDLNGSAPSLVLLKGSEVYGNIKSLRYCDTSWQYVSNENESYISYGAYVVLSQLRVSGKIEVWSQSSVIDTVPNCLSTYCGVYAICDDSRFPPICKCATGFEPKNLEEWSSADYSAGCVRKSSAQCDNMKEDSFLATGFEQ